MKRWLTFCLAVCMCISMAACASEETAVYVQKVSDLASYGGIAPGDKFAGIVVSENTAEVQKDNDMVVDECFVKEGDDVTQGQELFSYDTQQLKLSLDKQKLELEQMEATIESYEEQIDELEKERKKAKSGEKLQYTLQIQTVKLDLQEAEINYSAKQDSVKQLKDTLKNAVVLSPVTGRVRSVSENGTDNYGNPLPYITIQQSGAYRIKGILGELQQGSITEGTRLEILSRTDESRWSGTVALIDYENPTQENANGMMYGNQTNEMTTSSKYPFYVELDSAEGLILGQHVYLQMEGQDVAVPKGPIISSAFICFEEADGSTYVWADKSGKLEKRTVTLGEYNMMNDTYEILSGLSEDDHIAFPDMELCVEGAPTTKTAPAQDSQQDTPAPDMMVESAVMG